MRNIILTKSLFYYQIKLISIFDSICSEGWRPASGIMRPWGRRNSSSMPYIWYRMWRHRQAIPIGQRHLCRGTWSSSPLRPLMMYVFLIKKILSRDFLDKSRKCKRTNGTELLILRQRQLSSRSHAKKLMTFKEKKFLKRKC